MAEYKRYENESAIEFQYRVSKDKDLIGKWQDVADICNRELGYDYTECKYRKDFKAFEKMFSANQKELTSTDERFKEIERREFELQKQAKRYYDQRREFNKLSAMEARTENLFDKLKESAAGLKDVCPMLNMNNTENSHVHTNENEAVLFFSDWHYGMVTNNIYNTYNTRICIERVQQVIDKAKEILSLHKPKKLHVVLLGDAAHGAIHTSARVQSEELVCDQIIHVSELIAEAIYALSYYVESVDVYCTYGNHMRTVQEKHDSVHADNMERLIGWWLKERFSGASNIAVHEEGCFEFILINVFGYNILCSHGDLDDIKRIGITMNTVFDKKRIQSIDYTVTADKHHVESYDSCGIESTTVPSLCGTDDYANDKRLYSKPGQTMMIFNENGKDAVYNIMVN